MSSGLKRKFTESDSEPPDWSEAEKLQLLQEILAQCPEDDSVSYQTRRNKLKWEDINIGDHSISECQEMWGMMLGKVRKYRTLAEVVEDAKDMVENPNKYPRRAKAKVKHPDQPLRPMTAFFRYITQHRDKVKAENPDISNQGLVQLLAARWHSLSPAKQHKYLACYQKERKEFEEANARFLEQHPELAVAKKSQKAPALPSPLRMYLKAKLPGLQKKHPDLSVLQATSKLRKKYSDLKPDKKRKWIQKAVNAIPEYEEQVEQYLKQHPDYQPPQNKIRLTVEERHLNGEFNPGDSFPGAPEKPPHSAFSMFVKKKAQSVEGKSKDRFSELGRQWASLSDKKRQKYQKKFEKCKQQYLEEVENFKQTLSEDDLALYLKSLQPKKRRKVDTGNGAIN